MLVAFAEQAAVALQQGRLTAQAAEAERLAAGNSMRTALLAAVSHDLRTPLAGIKAAASALRSDDLDLGDADRAELVATIDESADRLTDLVDNLLDMSRLQAGAVRPTLSPSDVPAVVHRALIWLDAAERARVDAGLARRSARRPRRSRAARARGRQPGGQRGPSRTERPDQS